MNTLSDIVTRLTKLDLSVDEARLYTELLQKPSTHLQLSHLTGINRTKVYRLVEDLEKRGLIARRTDDRGTFLSATSPDALEAALAMQEDELKQRREILEALMPSLSQLQNNDPRAFVVRTYEGEAGLKQMCWHELQTKGELLAFGNGTIEQITSDKRWANKHRDYQIAAGYKTRELINYDYSRRELPDLTSDKLIESKQYSYRVLPADVATFDSQTLIYNDTVGIYHWKHDQKVGVEIISPTYARMMRHMFEYFWRLGWADET